MSLGLFASANQEALLIFISLLFISITNGSTAFDYPSLMPPPIEAEASLASAMESIIFSFNPSQQTELIQIIDQTILNCFAVYSTTDNDAITNQPPIVRVPPDIISIPNPETSQTETLCSYYAVLLVSNTFIPQSLPSLQTLMDQYGLDSSLTTINPFIDRCGSTNAFCLDAYAHQSGYNPIVMASVVSIQIIQHVQTMNILSSTTTTTSSTTSSAPTSLPTIPIPVPPGIPIPPIPGTLDPNTNVNIRGISDRRAGIGNRSGRIVLKQEAPNTNLGIALSKYKPDGHKSERFGPYTHVSIAKGGYKAEQDFLKEIFNDVEGDDGSGGNVKALINLDFWSWVNLYGILLCIIVSVWICILVCWKEQQWRQSERERDVIQMTATDGGITDGDRNGDEQKEKKDKNKKNKKKKKKRQPSVDNIYVSDLEWESIPSFISNKKRRKRQQQMLKFSIPPML